jgi:hypothetical protein
MSSANVDLVRSRYAAWERGDWSSVEWAHPGIEFVIADGPSPGAWSGVAGMVEGYRQVMNAWERYSARAEEYLSLDDERVLVLQRLAGARQGEWSGACPDAAERSRDLPCSGRQSHKGRPLLRPRASARRPRPRSRARRFRLTAQVAGGGFEPPKAEPMRLQRIPFDRSGTPPGGPRIAISYV